MARQRMITRSIISYEAECIVMDIKTVETSIVNYTITGDVSDKNKVLKNIKKLYENSESNLQIVAVRDIVEHEEMYGMLEVDFIAHAKKLDPETRKVLEEED